MRAALVFASFGYLLAVDPTCDYSQIKIAEECPSSVGLDWEVYGEELYKGRGLLFYGQPEESTRVVSHLLKVITNPFYVGFECPLATASTFFTLSQRMAMEGRLRRAQALLLMGFIFVRDRGFHDCTPWPVQGWDMLLGGRNVREFLRPIDDVAVNYQVSKNFVARPSSIAIVSVCAYAEGEPVRVFAEANHRLYAEIHGYRLFQFSDESEIVANEAAGMRVADRNKFFWKVNAVRNVFDDPSIAWAIWADCDAFFMDPDRTLESLVQMFASNTTTAPVKQQTLQPAETSAVWEEVHRKLEEYERTPVELLLAVDSTGINNGVWMMRNSDWSKEFLASWWYSEILQGKGKTHNCSDQSTMQHELLMRNAVADLTSALGQAWDSIEGPMWPPQVRPVPQEYLQSFHQATAQSVLSREYVDGDFIKHHPGCHYYKTPCQYMYQLAYNEFRDKVLAKFPQAELELQSA